MAHGRSVAQPGSALYWGCRGRGFESRRSDHLSKQNQYFMFEKRQQKSLSTNLGRILGRKILPNLSFDIKIRYIAAQSCLPGEFGLNEGRINLHIYFLGNLIGVIR